MMNKLLTMYIIAMSALAAAPTHALTQTPGLVYSDATLTIESHCTGCPARESKTVPLDDTTPLEHLTTFPGFRPFVLTGSPQPDAFVSSSATGAGVLGVGVSGVVNESERWAEAVYEQSIINHGNTNSPQQLAHIDIPEIRILTSFSEGTVDTPFAGDWRAEASIDIFWFAKDKDGAIVDTGNPISLNVIVDRANGRSSLASLTTTMSGQLEAFATGLTGLGGDIHDVLYTNDVPGIHDYDAIGHTFDAIDTDIALASDLNPGAYAYVPAFGTLELAYTMRVGYTVDEALIEDRITAFEIMVGDPFEIGGAGGAGGSFSVGELRVVPLPGSLGLLAIGSALLLARLRRPHAMTQAAVGEHSVPC